VWLAVCATFCTFRRSPRFPGSHQPFCQSDSRPPRWRAQCGWPVWRPASQPFVSHNWRILPLDDRLLPRFFCGGRSIASKHSVPASCFFYGRSSEPADDLQVHPWALVVPFAQIGSIVLRALFDKGQVSSEHAISYTGRARCCGFTAWSNPLQEVAPGVTQGSDLVPPSHTRDTSLVSLRGGYDAMYVETSHLGSPEAPCREFALENAREVAAPISRDVISLGLISTIVFEPRHVATWPGGCLSALQSFRGLVQSGRHLGG
jgi:hypothetical protein